MVEWVQSPYLGLIVLLVDDKKSGFIADYQRKFISSAQEKTTPVVQELISKAYISKAKVPADEDKQPWMQEDNEAFEGYQSSQVYGRIVQKHPSPWTCQTGPPEGKSVADLHPVQSPPSEPHDCPRAPEAIGPNLRAIWRKFMRCYYYHDQSILYYLVA